MELENIIVGNEEKIQILDKRFYVRSDGSLVPSVTTILKPWPKGDALSNWRGDKGNAEADEILRSAGVKGTNVHNGGELLLQGHKLNFDNYTLDEWKCLIAMQRFIEDYQVVPLYIERVLFGASRAGYKAYAGSCDLVCMITDPKTGVDKLTILDWKTSKSLHYTHDMQLMAYAQAFTQELGLQFEDWMVVQIGNKTKKGYTVHHVKEDKHLKILRDWELCCELFHATNPELNLRYQELPITLHVDHLIQKDGRK